MIDKEHIKLENQVKHKFKDFFNWWETLSLKVAKKQGTDATVRIKRQQLECFFGEVYEKIENADKKKLKKIINSRRVVSNIYKELGIENYQFLSVGHKNKR